MHVLFWGCYTKSMRVFCLYRPNTESERPVRELAREITRRYNFDLELVSVDTVQGARLSTAYDVWAFPAVLATDGVGVVQASWTDGQLPLISDLLYYLKP
jgi:hypothetical protein